MELRLTYFREPHGAPQMPIGGPFTGEFATVEEAQEEAIRMVPHHPAATRIEIDNIEGTVDVVLVLDGDHWERAAIN